MTKEILGVDKPVRVLVSLCADDESDYKWFAVALEMDVWGFGNTKTEAMDDLKESVATQIEFATARGEAEMLEHLAHKKWFDLWEDVERSEQESQLRKLCETILINSPLGEISAEFQFKKAA